MRHFFTKDGNFFSIIGPMKEIYAVKTFMLTGLLLFSQSILADVEVYKDTENTGQNKLERLEGMEKYLVQFSASIKNLESKIEEQSKKMSSLEKEVNALKELEDKRTKTALGQVRNDPQAAMAEIEKLKADFTTLKNDDIEQIRQDLIMLNKTMKDIRSRK